MSRTFSASESPQRRIAARSAGGDDRTDPENQHTGEARAIPRPCRESEADRRHQGPSSHNARTRTFTDPAASAKDDGVNAGDAAVAAVVLLVLFRTELRGRGLASLGGAACYAARLTTFVVATKWTTAANAIFLQYSGVVWVILLAPLALGEPLTGRAASAVVVALGGMALFEA